MVARQRAFSGHLVAIVLLAAVYLALVALFIRATPPLEASDEAGHFAFVLHAQRHHRLPVADPDDKSPTRTQEYSQPPLYYLLVAALVEPIDTDNWADFYRFRPRAPIGRADLPGPKHLLRIRGDRSMPWKGTMLAIMVGRAFSALLGLGTVLLTYVLAARLVPSDRFVPFVAAALVTCNPMFLFISGSINNDNLVILLTSLGLVSTLGSRQRGLPRLHCILLGILCGAAILSKMSGLLITALVGLVLITSPGRFRKRLQKTLLFAGTLAVVAGWWFVRNLIVYGDLTGFDAHAQIASNRRPAIEPLALLHEWDGFVKSFWGVFGGFNIIYPDWIYSVFYAITLLLLAAAVLASLGGGAVRRGTLWPVPTLVALNLVACAGWTSWLLGSQGRLMFYSIAAFSTLAVLGLAGSGRRMGRTIGATVVVVLAAAALYGALSVIPASYPPR